MAFTARQNLMIRADFAIAAKVGQWDQTAGSEGAGYVKAASNTGSSAGFACANCAFFRPSRQPTCGIVKGGIEPHGVCRLYVIDQDRLTVLTTSQGVKALASRGRLQGDTLR